MNKVQIQKQVNAYRKAGIKLDTASVRNLARLGIWAWDLERK
jgi:hypothetical protein